MAGHHSAEYSKNGCKNPLPLHLVPGRTLLLQRSLQPSAKQCQMLGMNPEGGYRKDLMVTQRYSSISLLLVTIQESLRINAFYVCFSSLSETECVFYRQLAGSD